MKDRSRALGAGLLTVQKSTCLACHDQAHGKPFDFETASKLIAHPAQAPARAELVQYKTPLNLAFRPGGKELYVTCESSSTVCVIDTATRRKLAEIPVGGQPTDVTFSPDGLRAYVTNRLDDSLSVVDTAARRVVATVPVGDEPHGVRTDPAGKTIYVLNTSSDDISVIDAATLQGAETPGRQPQPMGAGALARRQPPARHQRPLAVREVPRARAFRGHRHRHRGAAWSRIALKVPAANMLQGVAWHPSGRVRPGDPAAHQEPGADDAAAPGLDRHQRPGHRLGRRAGGPGAARRAGRVLSRPDRRRHHARRRPCPGHQRRHRPGRRGRPRPAEEAARGDVARRAGARSAQSPGQGDRVRDGHDPHRHQSPRPGDRARRENRLRGLCTGRLAHGHRHRAAGKRSSASTWGARA